MIRLAWNNRNQFNRSEFNQYEPKQVFQYKEVWICSPYYKDAYQMLFDEFITSVEVSLKVFIHFPF